MNYYKMLLLAVVVMVFSLTVQAQQRHFGVQAGYGLSNILADGAGDDYRGVFHVGLVWQSQLGSHFALAGKLLYDGAGSKSEGDPAGRISNDYLSIPIMAKWYFKDVNRNPNINGYLMAGPGIGILARAGLFLDGLDGGINTKSLYKEIDVGFHIGVGYESPMHGSTLFFFEVEGYFGATNVFNFSTIDPDFLDPELVDLKVVNRSFTLGAGVRF